VHPKVAVPARNNLEIGPCHCTTINLRYSKPGYKVSKAEFQLVHCQASQSGVALCSFFAGPVRSATVTLAEWLTGWQTDGLTESLTPSQQISVYLTIYLTYFTTYFRDQYVAKAGFTISHCSHVACWPLLTFCTFPWLTFEICICRFYPLSFFCPRSFLFVLGSLAKYSWSNCYSKGEHHCTWSIVLHAAENYCFDALMCNMACHSSSHFEQA
jgi:hypothetical protein